MVAQQPFTFIGSGCPVKAPGQAVVLAGISDMLPEVGRSGMALPTMFSRVCAFKGSKICFDDAHPIDMYSNFLCQFPRTSQT